MAGYTGPQLGRPTDGGALVLEAWIEGFLIGALIIMACITIANMRSGILLHKLILVELLLGSWAGTSIFNHEPVYGWYLSTTGLLIYISYTLHNTIAWIKNKPFLNKKASLFYIGTVILVIPYWIVNAYANYVFYNEEKTLFLKTRPLEAIFREPWWVFTTINLFWNIKSRYEFGFFEILRINLRFTILLSAMILSICFIIIDILSVTGVLKNALPVGINPFWKLSFVFKCLTDSVILDDFKTVLDRLHEVKVGRFASFGLTDIVRPSPAANADLQQHQSAAKPTSEYVEDIDAPELESGLRTKQS